MTEVAEEFDRALRRFERMGCVIPGDLALYISALGLQRIEPDDDLYAPGEHGEPAVIVPVYAGEMPSFMRPVDEIPQLIDLVAFRLSDPRRWWRRTGMADYLGEHLIQPAVTWHKRLRVLETPLAWLNARGGGVCPLSGDYSALRCVMAGLNIDDAVLADAVNRQHAHPFPSPPIFVRSAA